MSIKKARLSVAEELLVAAARLTFPSLEGRISALRDIVQTISSERGAQKTLLGQLERSVDVIGVALEKGEGREFSKLADNEKEAALLSLSRVLSSISDDDLFDTELDVQALNRVLDERAETDTTAFLSEDAIEYRAHYLRGVANYLPRIAHSIPGFHEVVAWRTLVTTRASLNQLIEMSLQAVVLPRYREGDDREAAAFEAAYRSWVLEIFGTMELFGLDVPPPSSPDNARALVTLNSQSTSVDSQNSACPRGTEGSLPTVIRRWRPSVRECALAVPWEC